jgi:hypothetical protein
MFNLDMLDVAIAVIFVYLLLSLVCTAINEMIEAFLKKRADYLERGIRNLVRNLVIGENTTAGSDMVAEIYSHSLIAGLFNGKYDLTAKANVFSGNRLSRFPVIAALLRRKLPSYIPSEHFAQAFLDIVSNPQNIKFNRDKLWQVIKSFNGKGMLDSVENLRSGIENEIAPLIRANINDPTTQKSLLNLLKTGDYDNLFAGLKTAVGEIPDPKIQDALNEKLAAAAEKIDKEFLPLVTNVRSQFETARKDVENWYNNSMDRVAGSYKRRAQIITFLLGLIVAVYINVDTVTIVKRLSHDKATRDLVVSASQEYAKAAAEKLKASPSPDASPAPSPDSVSNFNSCTKDANSPECKFETYKGEIASLGLPVGWKKAEKGKEFMYLNQLTSKLPLIGFTFELSPYFDEDYPNNNNRNEPFWLLKLLGWLITGAAVSLGAPFWFDVLNKFMVVRSTVKPKEKSKNEAQKDPKEK